MSKSFPFDLEHGVLYRNPEPHVRSLHGYFPSLVAFSREHLGAAVVIGQAFEAADLHVVYFESRDGGKSWQRKSNITHPSEALDFSTVGRIAKLSDGTLVANVARHERHRDDHGLTKGDSLAFVPTTLELYRSRDEGATWQGPEELTAPLAETSFEMCSPIRILSKGTWHWPTSTWPIGEVRIDAFETGSLVSEDEGRSWQRWQPIYPNNELIYWESKVIALDEERLLSTAWVHELACGKDWPNHYAIGSADGQQWSAPQSTGINGQTLEPVRLTDGRILAVYRRVDEPGIWASIATVTDAGWQNECEIPLWTGPHNLHGENAPKMREQFATLKCGAPSATLLPDGSVAIAFWAVVENVSQINTILLSPKSSR